MYIITEIILRMINLTFLSLFTEDNKLRNEQRRYVYILIW